MADHLLVWTEHRSNCPQCFRWQVKKSLLCAKNGTYSDCIVLLQPVRHIFVRFRTQQMTWTLLRQCTCRVFNANCRSIIYLDPSALMKSARRHFVRGTGVFCIPVAGGNFDIWRLFIWEFIYCRVSINSSVTRHGGYLTCRNLTLVTGHGEVLTKGLNVTLDHMWYFWLL